MNGQEIKERIIKNNEVIENANHSMFVLNKEVEKALNENMHLRSICPHVYRYNEEEKVNRCVFCGAAQELK